MRKKLFAILMSAMMMVTFMPAMAFAALPEAPQDTSKHKTGCAQDTIYVDYHVANAHWAADFSAVSVDMYCGESDCYCKLDTQLVADKVVRTWNSSTGKMTATAHFNALDSDKTIYYDSYTQGKGVPTGGDMQFAEGTDPSHGYKMVVEYYDLTGAYLAKTDSTTAVKSLDADEYIEATADTTTKVFTTSPVGSNVVTVMPEYAENTNKATMNAADKVKNIGTVDGRLVVKVTKVDYAAYEEGEYTLPVSITLADGLSAADKALFIGTPISEQKVTIATHNNSTNLKHVEATFGAEKKTLGTSNVWTAKAYTGEDQAFAVNTKGLKVEYQVTAVNGTTVTPAPTTWTETAPSVKNAGESKSFKVRVTKEKANSLENVVRTFEATISLTNATRPTVAFNQREYVVAQGCEPTWNELVTVTGIKAADATFAQAFAAKYFSITGMPKTLGVGYINVAFNSTQFAADFAAAAADSELKVFCANYGIVADATFTCRPAKVTLVEAKANKVTVSTASKTYKAKALKKAKKSFAVKATATSGDVTLEKVSGSKKLTLNGNKIVVKKGTKKGTYKIKVKASVAANNGYAAATATKTIKVKVK